MDTAPRQRCALAIHVAKSLRLICRHNRAETFDTGFHYEEC